MKRSVPMKRSGFAPKIKPLPGILRTANLPGQGKPKKRLKTTQRAVTPAERMLWDRMVQVVGCIACHLDGRQNHYCSIHHIDGRTKPGCHKKVLPICAGHHQDGTGEDKSLIAIHPHKARFEARYGSQESLLGMAMEKVGQ